MPDLACSLRLQRPILFNLTPQYGGQLAYQSVLRRRVALVTESTEGFLDVVQCRVKPALRVGDGGQAFVRLPLALTIVCETGNTMQQC